MRKSALARLSVLVLAATAVVGCRRERPGSSQLIKPEQPVTRAPTEQLVEGPPIVAEPTFAPNVPPPTNRRAPAKVIVELEVKEATLQIADGVQYNFWTFGGQVPGKFIRVRKGDTVELHLRNHPSSKVPHNIDLHAVTGPGGGATSTFTAPGHETQLTFKALNEGLFVYHCATAPVGMHIANGMYGMILVEPEEGLPPVDHEYYVMQGDFYTAGKTHEKGLQAFDLDKAVEERPTYVVFNGSEGSLVGDKALKARVGETVRLFVGNGGPNLTSSFHVIGEIFDHVYQEAGSKTQDNVQTTVIPPGGAAIVDMKVEVPGTYVLVDHAIFRAFHKGALGMLKVEGDPAHDIYSGQERDVTYIPGQPTPRDPIPAPRKAATNFDEQMEYGKQVFSVTCNACHQSEGQGVPHAFPPLAGSDFLMADKERAIGIVLGGLKGRVTVKGNDYDSQMPPFGHLSDEDIANVLTFVRNSWGNKGDAVSPAEVAKIRAAKGGGGEH